MIKFLNTRLLALLCCIAAIGIIASCKKNNDVKSDRIELLSFGPTGAMHGDTLKFIGHNLDKVTAINFTGTNANVAQSAFVSQSAEMIAAVVPDGAEQGFVTLKTPEGDIVSKTRFNLEVAPSVTAMTPEARPGQNITINGKFLNWVTRVTFPDNKSVDSFVSRSFDQIVVAIPMDAQTGPLILSYSGTEPLQMRTNDTLKVTLPAITSIAPNPIKHQTNLTINGTNLDLVKKIVFNGVSAPVTTFVSQTATKIVVKVPSSTTKGKLTLIVESGVTVKSSMDLDVVLPAATSLAPNPIDIGANLTINGTNLDIVTGISFVGVANAVTTFVSKTATKIVVKVPAGTLKGKLVLSVLNSTLTVETDELKINGGLPPLAPFAHAIYTDQFDNGFQDWSWAARVTNSTANVREGTHSIKATYGSGGYEGITFHNDNGPTTGSYSKLEFSVFGEPGTGNKTLNVVINGNWGGPATVTLAEGEWKTFSLTLSSLGNPSPLKEVVLQSAGWSGVIHIDHVGLR